MKITRIEIWWDTQDPHNEGWAWRIYDAVGYEIESCEAPRSVTLHLGPVPPVHKSDYEHACESVWVDYRGECDVEIANEYGVTMARKDREG